MSYDLQVYGRQAVDRDALVALVTGAGLAVDEGSGGSVTVVRGARRTPTFVVDGPDALEAEDVPDEITQVLLGARVLYSVTVEGSSTVSIPHALRFARRLATAVDGAVLDQQSGVWSRGGKREVEAVPHGTTDVVEVRWYGPPLDGVARLWLDLARRTLPEASPRRFGTYEPLRGRLDRDGDEAFETLVEHDDGLVFFAAHRPAVSGHLTGRADLGRTHTHGLTVLAEPLSDPAWRESLARLFTGFARATGSWFAAAEVLRGLDWNGRTLWHGATAESGIHLAPRGSWKGLSPRPVWWAWFGPDYAELVREHLPGTSKQSDAGLFHAFDGPPADRDRLLATVPVVDAGRRRWFGRRTGPRSDWLPTDLLAVPANDPPGTSGPPGPANVVPRALRVRT